MMASIFVKDARLRPPLRILVYGIVLICLFFVGAALLDALCAACLTSMQPVALAIQALFAASVVAATSFGLRRALDRRSLASLGFSPQGPWLRFFLIGIAFGSGMQALAVCVEALGGSVHLTARATLQSDLHLLATMVVTLLAAAFSEELSMRGYVLQNLWEAWGRKPAVFLSSVLFAAVHLSNPHSKEQLWLTLGGLLAFGLWTACSLLWSGSLWLALGAHAAWNLFEGPVFGLPVSGLVLSSAPVLSLSVHGPAWLTGGHFGPEAGASTLVALAFGFAVLRLLVVRGAFADQARTQERYATPAT